MDMLDKARTEKTLAELARAESTLAEMARTEARLFRVWTQFLAHISLVNPAPDYYRSIDKNDHSFNFRLLGGIDGCASYTHDWKYGYVSYALKNHEGQFKERLRSQFASDGICCGADIAGDPEHAKRVHLHCVIQLLREVRREPSATDSVPIVGNVAAR